MFKLWFYQDIAGTLATEQAEDPAQVAKLRSALESVDHKRRKVVIFVPETTSFLLFLTHLARPKGPTPMG